MAFKVFEADLEMSRWVDVERLDDEVLFISTHCSEAIRLVIVHSNIEVVS